MKKFSSEKTKGNTGQSTFEAIITPNAVVHKIDESKDIGIDYICEWKNDEEPTGVIFVAQVKDYPSHIASLIGKDQNLNLLNKYNISPTISIDSDTQDYWKLLEMPSYLFVVIPNGNSVDMFYKRYTPILTGNKASQSESPFFKANNGLNFLAFADATRKVGGFARDLYIDQMRASYNKGQIAYMNPRRLGLGQFPDQDKGLFFRDIFQEYKINFEETFEQLRKAMGTDYEEQAIPSKAPEEDDE